MKILLLTIWVGLFIFACVPTNRPLEQKPTISVDPFVQNWLEKPASLTSEQMAILVISKTPLKEYSFLKHAKGNYYTGHVTRDQLQLLLKDKRILRISGGEQKLHQK